MSRAPVTVPRSTAIGALAYYVSHANAAHYQPSNITFGIMAPVEQLDRRLRRDRKARKGDFRKLWITRINAAARENGMTYNRLIQGLKLAGVEVDRRVLADLAVNDAGAFATLVKVAKDALPADVNAASTPAA